MCELVQALFRIAIVFCPLGGPLCFSQELGEPTARDAPALIEFLQHYVGEPDQATRYKSAEVDLNGDGIKEVIVYFVGNRWCGSGGCSALILQPQGSSYKIVTKLTIVRPPISVLTRTSYGWSNLTVYVRGGGILGMYEAELPFIGTKYPSNPSVSPAAL